MPEITDAQYNEYRAYLPHGTPEAVAALAKKNGDLESDNKKLRDQRTELNKKVPAEGAVVLQGDEAKRWEAFVALGKTPEELAAGTVLTPDERKEYEAFKALDLKADAIAAVVTENETLKADAAQRAWTDSVAAMAKAERIPEDSVPALSAILRALDPKAVIEVKTEKGKDAAGKDVDTKVGYITLTGKQAAKFADLRNETAELKGIRTEAGTEKKEDGNQWFEQETQGKSTARSPDDHRKAVTAQLDYQV